MKGPKTLKNIASKEVLDILTNSNGKENIEEKIKKLPSSVDKLKSTLAREYRAREKILGAFNNKNSNFAIRVRDVGDENHYMRYEISMMFPSGMVSNFEKSFLKNSKGMGIEPVFVVNVNMWKMHKKGNDHQSIDDILMKMKASGEIVLEGSECGMRFADLPKMVQDTIKSELNLLSRIGEEIATQRQQLDKKSILRPSTVTHKQRQMFTNERFQQRGDHAANNIRDCLIL